MIKLTDHFEVEEFRCMTAGKPCKFCGGTVIVDEDLMLLALQLEALRSKLSEKLDDESLIHILSGHRCFEKNLNTSTCIPHFCSSHLKVAADIRVSFKKDGQIINPVVVYGYADKIFRPGGVGLYTGHVHVDLRKWVARW